MFCDKVFAQPAYMDKTMNYKIFILKQNIIINLLNVNVRIMEKNNINYL